MATLPMTFTPGTMTAIERHLDKSQPNWRDEAPAGYVFATPDPRGQSTKEKVLAFITEHQGEVITHRLIAKTLNLGTPPSAAQYVHQLVDDGTIEVVSSKAGAKGGSIYRLAQVA